MNDDDEQEFRAEDVGPGEPPRVTVTRHGLVINDENGVSMHAHDGSVTTLRRDGIIETQNPAMKRIAIHDALLIESSQSTRHLGTVSHVLQFKGGGWFAYMQDAQGKLIETTSRGVRVVTDWDGLAQIYGTDTGATMESGRHDA